MTTALSGLKVRTEMVDLRNITSNSAQTRGTGVVCNLNELGTGMFEKIEADKDPIWTLLLHDKPEKRKEGVTLIQEHESGIAALGEGLEMTGQLQPIGLLKLKDGEFDVIFGMRRALAWAYNYARDFKNNPKEIEAKIFEGKISPAELKLMALEENGDREGENPIDLAMTYTELAKEHKMLPDEIGKRVGMSGQNIRNYMKLLDKKLEDKRVAIRTRTLSVDAALKLLSKRKNGDTDASTREEAANGGRHRLPGMKALVALLEAKSKPKKVTPKEWQWYTNPTVRQFLCFMSGVKYKEFKEEEAPPESDKPKASRPSNNNGEKAKKKLVKVKKERAIQLLISLGKTQARTWDDAKIKTQLENIVNIVEPGQKAETDSLQKLLDTLVSCYSDGLVVEVVAD